MNSGAKGTWFFLGMTVSVLYLMVTEPAVLKLLREDFGWEAIAAIATFFAVVVAIYQVFRNSFREQKLSSQQRRLAIRMLEEPINEFSKVNRHFLEIIPQELKKYNKLKDEPNANWQKGPDLVPEIEVQKRGLFQSINYFGAELLDADFGLIQANLNYLVDASPTLIDNVFKVINLRAALFSQTEQFQKNFENYESISIIYIYGLVRSHEELKLVLSAVKKEISTI